LIVAIDRPAAINATITRPDASRTAVNCMRIDLPVVNRETILRRIPARYVAGTSARVRHRTGTIAAGHITQPST
jgi:hypothetical protein